VNRYKQHSIAAAAADQLLAYGYAVIDNRANLDLVESIYASADSFFRKDHNAKVGFASASHLEGYRPLGAEYSEVPGRRDLNESFAVWLKNVDRPDLMSWMQDCDLHSKMRKLLPNLVETATDILERLRILISPDAQPTLPSEFSYLQLNYYTLSAQARPILMDAHEDGHLLTITAANQPGLQVDSSGQFVSVDLRLDQLVVWPGSILTALTGGRLRPLYHRVVKLDTPVARQSINCFVNPSLERGQPLWVNNAENRGLDIADIAISKSTAFGLSSLDQL